MYPEQPPTLPPKVNNHLIGVYIVGFIALVLLGTTIWMFLGKSEAQSNLDAKIATAVTDAEEAKAKELNAQFEEDSKYPYKKVKMAESLGGVSIEYPKSWSVYVIEKESGNDLIDLYGQPGVVPDADGDTAFYLRLQLVDDTYDKTLSSYDKHVQKGETKASPYKSNGVLGSKLVGWLDSDITGTMVVLPLRDKTLMVWTEVSAAEKDLNKILETLVFQP